MDFTLLKIFLPSLVSFSIGMGLAPFVTHFLYKNRMWKRDAREAQNPVMMSKEYESIHNTESEKKTPRIGGVLIWMSVLCTAIFFWLLAWLLPSEGTLHIEFISRSQTWLIFFVFILGAMVGLVDDLSQIVKWKLLGTHGFPRKIFLSIIFTIALASAFWFYTKLGMSSVSVPFLSNPLELGWAFIPFFVLVMLGTFSSGVIDGIDGLSGGVLGIVFAAFGTIALVQGQNDIATFCFVLAASILPFLWFNVPPARFYMGETGMLALTLSLTYVAFLMDRALWIPIIGLPLLATSLSSFLQIVSKKYLKKKVFKVAPLHHHFQALGWSSERVVMRYWIFTTMCAVAGIAIAII